MDFLILMLLGCAVGIVGALMGIGGGLLVVPVFLYVMGYSVQHTVGTAMVIVFFNAASAAWAYYKQGRIHYSSAWKFGLATIPGAVLGGHASDFVSGSGFQLLFGIFLLAVAANMCWKNSHETEENAAVGELRVSRVRLGIGSAASVLVGFLSSVLGIGGGVIHVPMMNQLLRYPMHIAVGTSSSILLISSLGGLLSHGALGHVLWSEAVCTGFGAVIGAQLGARLAYMLSPRYLRLAFSVLVFGMAVKFISVAVI